MQENTAPDTDGSGVKANVIGRFLSRSANEQAKIERFVHYTSSIVSNHSELTI